MKSFRQEFSCLLPSTKYSINDQLTSMKAFTTLLLTTISAILLHAQPYRGDQAIVKSEFIYQSEDVKFPSCHASTIAETQEGLLAAWFGGTAEKDPDVGIWISRFANGKWSVPTEVANGVQNESLRYPTWNPVLFNAGKEIILFYKVGPNCSDWWGEYITSSDNGHTWSKPVRLPDDIWGPIKNKPVLLPNGELLCPSSTEKTGWQVHLESTTDWGKTWKRTPSINDGKEVGAIQPTVLIHSGSKLQILCRSTNKMILSSWSNDLGKTWSKLEPIQLPNPNSGIDGVTLQDGRHALVYNHIKPAEKWGDRNILNLALSDNGKKWKAALLLENDPDADTEYSYPAIIQASNGLLHITYTWNRKLIKHVVVDPSKLTTRPMVKGSWPAE